MQNNNLQHLLILTLCAVMLRQGVKDFSEPVGLDAKVKVDLVVVGSVAVSEKGLLVPEIHRLNTFYNELI